MSQTNEDRHQIEINGTVYFLENQMPQRDLDTILETIRGMTLENVQYSLGLVAAQDLVEKKRKSLEG